MKYLLVIFLSLAGGVLGGYLVDQVPAINHVLGATTARTTITNPWIFASTTQSGTSGTPVSRLNTGFCNIRSHTTTIAASSTQTVECNAGTGSNVALTGVTAGDTILIGMPTTTPTTFGGLKVVGASASSTAGSITLILFNGTGGTFTWTAAASTSLPYIVLDQ